MHQKISKSFTEKNHKTQSKILCKRPIQMEGYSIARWGPLNIVKMFILSKMIYRYNKIPIKIPKKDFHETSPADSKISIEEQRAKNSQDIPGEKKKEEDHSFSRYIITEEETKWTKEIEWTAQKHTERDGNIYDKVGIAAPWVKNRLWEASRGCWELL